MNLKYFIRFLIIAFIIVIVFGIYNYNFIYNKDNWHFKDNTLRIQRDVLERKSISLNVNKYGIIHINKTNKFDKLIQEEDDKIHKVKNKEIKKRQSNINGYSAFLGSMYDMSFLNTILKTDIYVRDTEIGKKYNLSTIFGFDKKNNVLSNISFTEYNTQSLSFFGIIFEPYNLDIRSSFKEMKMTLGYDIDEINDKQFRLLTKETSKMLNIITHKIRSQDKNLLATMKNEKIKNGLKKRQQEKLEAFSGGLKTLIKYRNENSDYISNLKSNDFNNIDRLKQVVYQQVSKMYRYKMNNKEYLHISENVMVPTNSDGRYKISSLFLIIPHFENPNFKTVVNGIKDNFSKIKQVQRKLGHDKIFVIDRLDNKIKLLSFQELKQLIESKK